MRCLGVIGGTSWESTLLYYRLINQGVAARRGGLHSARLLVHSVDFAPLAALQAAGAWDAAADVLIDAARGLRAAGADGLLLATNTMHKVADAVQSAASLPLLHIADATGAALARAGLRRAGLLGTRFTMDDPSIVQARLAAHGVQVLLPGEPARADVHRIIYGELCRGVVDAASRQRYVSIIGTLGAAGAQGLILGCTEITMLVDAACSPLPVFDSTALHAAAAVDWLLQDRPAHAEPSGDPTP
ncbi:aspartate/glutamate racemase family protein [Pseudorhodoferax sp.]|uniref:aspartate/glutamate racemase family protein n=1 Tax=Pseudorhodoferax sp. TaxID=1993553 RepID=UPI002DD63581|nr:aspartate/glutamate racemase family protein [Pseudorhodoferax sp.]